MPYPFSRGIFICGKPVWVDKEATEQELEKRRQELEQTLNEITHRADRYFR